LNDCAGTYLRTNSIPDKAYDNTQYNCGSEFEPQVQSCFASEFEVMDAVVSPMFEIPLPSCLTYPFRVALVVARFLEGAM